MSRHMRRGRARRFRAIQKERRRWQLAAMPPRKSFLLSVGDAAVYVWPAAWRLIDHPWAVIGHVTQNRVLVRRAIHA